LSIKERYNRIDERFYNLINKIFIIYCIVVLLFLIAPIMIIIPMSFSRAEYLEFPPQSFSFKWYLEFFKSEGWLSATFSSFEVAFLTMCLTTILGLIAAYGIFKAQFPGKNIINAIFILPIFMPFIIIAVSLYGIFAKWNLTGNLFGFVLAHTVICFPFTFINISASLKNFDPFYEMAAFNLGATKLKTFLLITIPLIKNGILIGSLFSFIMSFDEAVIAIFLSGVHFTTLPKKMFDGIQFGINPIISSVSTLLIIVNILFFIGMLLIKKSETLKIKK
jgi:ABC-type spermidine/putrescine transport system permease subunit II